MSLYWLRAAAPVRLAEDDITTRRWAPDRLKTYILVCIAPRRPRQEFEQVRAQLRYCFGRPLLPFSKARWRVRNGPRRPCSRASWRDMISRTLAPRWCASRSARTKAQLLRFQVIARILLRLKVCRI